MSRTIADLTQIGPQHYAQPPGRGATPSTPIAGSSRQNIKPEAAHAEAVLNTLQSRFRADAPYTYIGSTALVVCNPNKTLPNLSDRAAEEYLQPRSNSAGLSVEPHPFDLAGRAWRLLRARGESQAIVYSGISGSGKSFSRGLVTKQLLRLSAAHGQARKAAQNIEAVQVVLSSFGHAKTLRNANASQYSQYLEMFFERSGALACSRVLTFGLNKSRVNQLDQGERSFHVFYQLLAGATPQEREEWQLQDPTGYAMLNKSGVYQLLGGPNSDDALCMQTLREAMQTLGFKARHQSGIFAFLAGILTLSNITFTQADSRAEETTIVDNQNVLQLACKLLGLSPQDLELALTVKTKYIRHDFVTVVLQPDGAAKQRDKLLRDMYAVLFAFVIEVANGQLCPADFDVYSGEQLRIVQLDGPGFRSHAQQSSAQVRNGQMPLLAQFGSSTYDDLMSNYGAEVQNSYLSRRTFDDNCSAHILSDNVKLPNVASSAGLASIMLLRGGQIKPEQSENRLGGVLGMTAKAAHRFKKGHSIEHADNDLHSDLNANFGHTSAFIQTNSAPHLFGINHYAGTVTYDMTDFVANDADLFDSGLLTILRQSQDPFVSRLISGPALIIEAHPRDEQVIATAQVSTRCLRRPAASNGTQSVDVLNGTQWHALSLQLDNTLTDVLNSLNDMNLFQAIHIKTSDLNQPNSLDKRFVQSQIKSLGLGEMSLRKSADYITDYEIEIFCSRFSRGDAMEYELNPRQQVDAICKSYGWRLGREYDIGTENVWVAYPAFAILEQEIIEMALEPDDDSGLRSAAQISAIGASSRSPIEWQVSAMAASSENLLRSGQQDLGTDSKPEIPGWKEREALLSIPKDRKANKIEIVPTSLSRRVWVIFCRLVTLFVPSFALKYCGGMKRPDMRMAWREKVTLCALIFLFCATIIFYIVGFGKILCPEFNRAYSIGELGGYNAIGDNHYYVAVRGRIYNLDKFWKGDHSSISGVTVQQSDMIQLAGLDLSQYFPPVLSSACPNLGVTDNTVLWINPDNVTTNDLPQAIHIAGAQTPYPGSALADPNWYEDRFLPRMKEYEKGDLVYEKKNIASQASGSDPRNWIIYENGIYDLSFYFDTISRYAASSGEGIPNYNFLDSAVAAVFKQYAGADGTTALNQALSNLNTTARAANLNCIQNAFYVGKTDYRKTPRCAANNIILLVFTCILCATIAIKFLAALRFLRRPNPEIPARWVICQVPCYTEDEESLQRAIDSIATLRYDDRRKLLFIICDGNIIGSGNDRPTPQIVLDLLGADTKHDPEPLAFKSLGDGSKQMNYGKVYSGLYETEGHIVPYIVVVKVGKPSERHRPGNRGKRDSQILLMRFLNRVHFTAPMYPLELEIYHQIKSVIGVDPRNYEFLFMVDADTLVEQDSLNHLVAAAVDDSRIIGICGETRLENEDATWWTRIQVYEYFISHHLAKAFESYFRSVTCLPGCFTMYRIRTVDGGRPLIISKNIIDDYSENQVDTLHKKNLLSLGEDRYLTTLMMKYFPASKFSLAFTPHAQCRTIAPDSWSVLLSQRRRWINSTIHNLSELTNLKDMCGCCCFSMRFIVLIDLIGTIMLPATVVYLVYLIVEAATGATATPWISIGIIAGTYGLQAILFLLQREWAYIGWMIIYMISFSIWSFILPLYAFWHFDDFSWGTTRVVVGEGANKQVLLAEDDGFDDSDIPLMTYEQYLSDIFEREETKSVKSLDSYAYSEMRGSPLQPSNRFSKRATMLTAVGSTMNGPTSYAAGSTAGDHYRDTNKFDQPAAMRGLPTMNSRMSFQPLLNDVHGLRPGRELHMSQTRLHMGGDMDRPYSTPTSLAADGDDMRRSLFSVSPSEPSGEAVTEVIRLTMQGADLMTLTKRQLRTAVFEHWPQHDMTHWRDFINAKIDEILAQQ